MPIFVISPIDNKHLDRLSASVSFGRPIVNVLIIMGNKSSNLKEIRTVEVGVINKADKKKHNAIKTSKYSILTFFPKNLIEQFRRLANFYFLIVTLIAVIIDSPVSPFTSLSPLAFVISVTMAKQGYEDWLRHRVDNTVNNEPVSVIRNSTLQKIKSHQIRPGELVKIGRDCDVPCDAVLLWTSDSRGKCFVTTANLDGETSLKPLKVPGPLAGTSLDAFKKEITIEFLPPEADIYTFYGKVNVDENISTPITTENLLLRGSRVKNTEWAIGCAIYTGEETKLALNSKFTSNKFTSSEAYINNFLIFFIVLMIAEIEISFFLKRYYEREQDAHESYLGPSISDNSIKSIAQDTFSFLLLYYYCIPISLYVTIEMQKFIGSKFFEWDEELVCPETQQKPLVNTSDLNEELGQIEILFSDKTGTLTKNDMYFQMCSVKGQLFVEKEKKLFEMNIEWKSGDMIETVEAVRPDVHFFFKILALCHTVQVEEETFENLNGHFMNGKKMLSPEFFDSSVPKTPIYQAISADEIAFVKAAANYGIIFDGDDVNKLFIKYKDGSRESFTKLHTLEFTSARKRMSVIVRDNNGKIWLFCKGAESAILPLCRSSPLIGITDKHIQCFAEQGLRTLAVAFKELTEEEYAIISEDINSYNMDIHRRIGKEGTTDRWKSIEDGLTLLGATAVEDRLQDNVRETMEALREAGVKIWVLTGDKAETAINVAQSCGHIPPTSTKLYLVDILTTEELEIHLDECIRISNTKSRSNYTLILDGQSFALLYKHPKEDAFVELSLKCEAVICCRLSPLQKAQIIRLIKKSKDSPVTAAVGDGANDISMIQEAHVGFGIFGKEGRQAARAADFSFANFMMLKKIFLVHGHWYYERLATLVQYSFYKNLCFVNLMIFFQFQTNFSSQSIMDSYFLTFFNLFFASAPILVIALTEHCHSKEELLKYPIFYKNQSKNKLFSWDYFFGWCALAIYHSIIIYYFIYALWVENPALFVNGHVAGLWCFGAALSHCLIIVINLKIWMHARYQTLIFIGFTLLTIFGFIGLTAGYAFFNLMDDGDVLGVYTKLLSSPSFWLANVLIVIATLQIDFVYRVFKDFQRKTYYEYEKEISISELTRL